MTKADVLAQVEEKLRPIEGLKDLRTVDEDFKDGIMDMERKAETQSREAGLMTVINEGFWNTMSRQVQVALVLSPENHLIRGTTGLLQLKDGEGNLLGEWVNPDRMEALKKRKDVRFISRDFVLYRSADIEGEPFFVLPDVDFQFLDEVEGVRSVTSCSPSGAADEYIRKEMGFDEPRLMSHLIGFDVIGN